MTRPTRCARARIELSLAAWLHAPQGCAARSRGPLESDTLRCWACAQSWKEPAGVVTIDASAAYDEASAASQRASVRTSLCLCSSTELSQQAFALVHVSTRASALWHLSRSRLHGAGQGQRGEGGPE